MKQKCNPFNSTSLPLALLVLTFSQSVQADMATTAWIDATVGNLSNWGANTNWALKRCGAVQKAGPSRTLPVSGSANTVTLTDLLPGDAWFCSDQSNLVMTVMKGAWCGYGVRLKHTAGQNP